MAGHVAAGSLGKAVADIEGDVTLILADTNELQQDDVPALIAGLNDPTAAAIADEVWDEPIADHQAAGSTGEALGAAGGGSTPSAIADAVWDEPLAGHATAGSAGKALSDVEAKVITIKAKTDLLAFAGTDVKATLDAETVDLSASGVDLVTIEPGLNLRQAMTLCTAAAAGEIAGSETDTVVIQGAGTNTTRISALVDGAGNRVIVTLTLPT